MPMQSMASGGQVQGYQDSGDVMKDAPSFVQNQFDPAQYGLGYSFMGQPQQTAMVNQTGTAPGAATNQVPEGQTYTVLYHPDYAKNKKSKSFYLPRDSKIYAEYIKMGYTLEIPGLGPTDQEETPTTDTPVTTDLTGAKVTTGGGRKKRKIETDPYSWMDDYDYKNLDTLKNQTITNLTKDPVPGARGLLENIQTAAESAGHIIVLANNGAPKEEVDSMVQQYEQFIKDAKLGLVPKGLLNGDKFAKDIAANNIDIALFENSTDPFGNRIFKDANDFNRFSQKIGPKGRGSKGIKDAFTRVKQKTKDIGTTPTGEPPERPKKLVTGRVDSRGFQAGDPEYTSALKQRQLDKAAADKRKKKQREKTRENIRKTSDRLDRKSSPKPGAKSVREKAKITFRKADNPRGFTGGFDKGGLMNKKGKKK